MFLRVSCLRRVVFEGEEGVDEGGVARELFAIAIRDFLTTRSVLRPCGDHDELLWFTRVSDSRDNHTELSEEYLLGVIVGLACHNGILVNLPLVPVVYKLWMGGKVSEYPMNRNPVYHCPLECDGTDGMYTTQPALEDMWGVDSSLARALQVILDFEADNSTFVETFGATFVASTNPVMKCVEEAGGAGVELVPQGSDIFVINSNRKEFVDKFLCHALYGCCRGAVDDFMNGLKVTLHTVALDLCSHSEVYTQKYTCMWVHGAYDKMRCGDRNEPSARFAIVT